MIESNDSIIQIEKNKVNEQSGNIREGQARLARMRTSVHSAEALERLSLSSAAAILTLHDCLHMFCRWCSTNLDPPRGRTIQEQTVI